MLGNISLALSSTESREETYQWLADAERASLQARDLTQQLLTFSKGGAPILKSTSVVDIIRESAKFALHGSNVRCRFSLPQNLPAVKADVGQINQVLSNIIINADQAMPDGGEIVISASGVHIRETSQLSLKMGDYIKLEIKDQGIGISKQHLSKIFDPFFTTKQKGNGLGLATAYSIIKKHGGHLMAQSELGKGSKFTIYLPVTGSPVSPAAASPMPYRCMQNCRILIMDDDELIRTMTVKALEKCGCSADFTDNGNDAIEFYKKARESGNPYDLVIMDLTIPGGMGGREAILILKKIDPDIKAVVSSGYSSDPVMSNPQKYGFDAGIAKPFKVDALYKIVGETMDRNTVSETVCC